MRLHMIMVAQFHQQSILPYIGRNAFELQGLEASPSEEGGVCGGKFPEVLGQVLVCIPGRGHASSLRYLGSGVLADSLV